jgi:hypothetical protein
LKKLEEHIQKANSETDAITGRKEKDLLEV